MSANTLKVLMVLRFEMVKLLCMVFMGFQGVMVGVVYGFMVFKCV